MKPKFVYLTITISLLSVLLFVGATARAQDPTPPPPPPVGGMTITQTLSDGAQRNTIAFDAPDMEAALRIVNALAAMSAALR